MFRKIKISEGFIRNRQVIKQMRLITTGIGWFAVRNLQLSSDPRVAEEIVGEVRGPGDLLGAEQVLSLGGRVFCSYRSGYLASSYCHSRKRITHLVDKLIESTLHEAGIDLYENDAHVGLVNLWYSAGHYLLPDGHWDRLLRAYVAAMRQRTPEAYSVFDRALTTAAAAASPEDRDFVAGILLARGKLN